MKKHLALAFVGLTFSLAATADVWKWVDNDGKTHFVDTETPIYTWTDENGEYHYSDTPGHEDAVSVELVWHSSGSLADLGDSAEEGESGSAYPGESLEDRYEREQAEAYYCKRATEIYESYLNAPQLYRTNDQGEREYLDKEDKAKTLAETRARKNELCS